MGKLFKQLTLVLRSLKQHPLSLKLQQLTLPVKNQDHVPPMKTDLWASANVLKDSRLMKTATVWTLGSKMADFLPVLRQLKKQQLKKQLLRQLLQQFLLALLKISTLSNCSTKQ